TLEESNLNRQVVFREKDVGNLKTDVLEKSLKEINSDLQYDFKNIYVDSSEKIRDIISTADIVILALDEPIIDSSLWVYNECKLQKKKIISGGVWGDNITYTYFDYSIDNQPCYQCLLDEDLNRDEITRTYIENVRGKHFSNFNTTTIFTGSVLAGIITTEITKILTSYSTPLSSGTTLTLNTSTWELNMQNIIVKKLCLSCEKEY
ncbi:ThiF family adenylyltransferase, partial [Streptococcus uberis]|uniref:ThiF family adenylyltransferase n=1 Tax=Streptococcus uberis TaxID=1349 RepID=UPI00333E79D7